MNAQEQAYIEGFVKRAAEYGFSNEEAVNLLKTAITKAEMYDHKASVPLNTIFGGTPIGIAGSALRDVNTPNSVPSRLLNISAPSLLGGIGGTLLGGSVSDMVGASPEHKVLAALASGTLGGMAGGYFGTKHYNDKIDEALKDEKIPYEKSNAVRVRHSYF
jgi:hypothetical protein